MRSIRFPARYYQAPNAISYLGKFVGEFGQSGFVLIDSSISQILQQPIETTFSKHSLLFHIETHQGECSDKEIARVTQAFKDTGSEVVIGVGGGKVIDTAKMVSTMLKVPLIVVPSIASSDAPCSALSVVYSDSGMVDRDVFLPRSPEIILVDSQLIANAPVRFLTAGIGDALATWYEAESCRLSGAKNCLGTKGSYLSYSVARNCLDTIREFGKSAVVDCKSSRLSQALERVIEANILMSCIGFESGGVAAAHAIHHGLCELEDVHHALHGEKVSIGVLASLLMKNDVEAYEDVKYFCQSVDLPICLADIGIEKVTKDKLSIIAKRACREGEIIYNEPFQVTEAMVIEALSRLE